MDGHSSCTPSTWSFQLMTTLPTKDALSYTSQPGGLLPALRALMTSFAEPWRSAWAWLPDDTHISISTMSYWMPEEWDARGGRVSLVGDAGHAMPFRESASLVV
jgi:2-polyprenyl-6-methoxyphenol hydroxylase-like FAD-dependent oxidoreductase